MMIQVLVKRRVDLCHITQLVGVHPKMVRGARRTATAADHLNAAGGPSLGINDE